MKVNILTYHFVPNYGAVLQVYALQKILENYVDNVEVLDYRPVSITKTYKNINMYSYKSFIDSVYSLSSYQTKKSKFKSFRNKYLKLSEGMYESDNGDIYIDADFIFLGSDQIWNFEITNGFDPVYFAKFKQRNESKVISYAASIGKGHLTQQEKDIFKDVLNNVDELSVREIEAANILKDCTKKDIEVVIDPTLLLEKEDWDAISTSRNDGRYVLLYTLADYKETREMAVSVAKYKNIKLIEISGNKKSLKKRYSHTVLYNAGPIEFISLIKNAEYIVTDSFHGTVFSILFNKQFVTIPHKTRGGRILGILQKLNLETRLSSVFDERICTDEIDYDKVNRLLRLERKASIDFIEKSLSRNK